MVLEYVQLVFLVVKRFVTGIHPVVALSFVAKSLVNTISCLRLLLFFYHILELKVKGVRLRQ